MLPRCELCDGPHVPIRFCNKPEDTQDLASIEESAGGWGWSLDHVAAFRRGARKESGAAFGSSKPTSNTMCAEFPHDISGDHYPVGWVAYTIFPPIRRFGGEKVKAGYIRIARLAVRTHLRRAKIGTALIGRMLTKLTGGREYLEWTTPNSEKETWRFLVALGFRGIDAPGCFGDHGGGTMWRRRPGWGPRHCPACGGRL